jgi:hypothetical protein
MVLCPRPAAPGRSENIHASSADTGARPGLIELPEKGPVLIVQEIDSAALLPVTFFPKAFQFIGQTEEF